MNRVHEQLLLVFDSLTLLIENLCFSDSLWLTLYPFLKTLQIHNKSQDVAALLWKRTETIGSQCIHVDNLEYMRESHV